MEDKPISVGDLVMVVKPSFCGCCHLIGVVFVATGIKHGTRRLCRKCGKAESCDEYGVTGYMIYSPSMYRLKRVNPPAAGDSLPTREKIKEPA